MYILRCRRPQAAKLAPRRGVGRSAVPAGKENPAGIVSWRTRRMARRKRDVPDLPYAAPPLSCAAFFVKVQNSRAYRLTEAYRAGGMPR